MLWPLKNKIKVCVHNGTFHPDDVFAVAILSLYTKSAVKVFRSRDPKVWAMCDYVCDVGGEYNSAQRKFDHHQSGYDEKRENGIVYSSAGLVWKEFGEVVCGSAEIARKIDEKIIQAIDANDNGITLSHDLFEGISSYTFGDYIFAFNPLFSEKTNSLDAFTHAVSQAKAALEREITRAKEKLSHAEIVRKAYAAASDKRIIVLDESYSWKDVLMEYPEPLFVISPVHESGTWHVRAVPKKNEDFENRRDLPESWAGKRDSELAKETGVADAVFCHLGRFIAAAKSKEGAIALAKLALEN